MYKESVIVFLFKCETFVIHFILDLKNSQLYIIYTGMFIYLFWKNLFTANVYWQTLIFEKK